MVSGNLLERYGPYSKRKEKKRVRFKEKAYSNKAGMVKMEDLRLRRVSFYSPAWDTDFRFSPALYPGFHPPVPPSWRDGKGDFSPHNPKPEHGPERYQPDRT